MATADNLKGVQYTLYYNQFSICSLMMRWLVEIRGEPKDDASRMNIGLREIDIFKEEQFEEWYLCDVNKNGQVYAPTTLHSVAFLTVWPGSSSR